MWKCPKCDREFNNTEQDHFCKKPDDIDEYIAMQPEDIQRLLQSIREAIRSVVPDAKEKISWQMPTFWQGENLIHFAAFKKHIGIYPGGEAVGVFAERLTKYKTSKGAIQLPLDKPIDYELITDIVQWRVKQVDERESIKKEQGRKDTMKQKIFTTAFSSVYPLYIQKAEKKGRIKKEVDTVICWLTGYDEHGLQAQIEKEVDFGTFFAEAPQINVNAHKITGTVCGVRVEEVEDPLMQRIRWLDKLVDELAKGKPMEKILRNN